MYISSTYIVIIRTKYLLNEKINIGTDTLALITHATVLTPCYDKAYCRMLQVGSTSTFSAVKCECLKMSSDVKTFASGFTMPKINPINFKHVFSNLDSLIRANPAVLATVISILVMYVLGLVWARHVDKKDIAKVSVRVTLC